MGRRFIYSHTGGVVLDIHAQRLLSKLSIIGRHDGNIATNASYIGSAIKLKNPACVEHTPSAGRSLSKMLIACFSWSFFSRSPWRHISSCKRCAHAKWTSHRAAVWERSAHLTSILSARRISPSSTGHNGPSSTSFGMAGESTGKRADTCETETVNQCFFFQN